MLSKEGLLAVGRTQEPERTPVMAWHGRQVRLGFDCQQSPSFRRLIVWVSALKELFNLTLCMWWPTCGAADHDQNKRAYRQADGAMRLQGAWPRKGVLHWSAEHQTISPPRRYTQA